MKDFVIGIDVGGTKVAYGLFDADKNLIMEHRHHSDAALSPADFFNRVFSEVKALCNKAGVPMENLRGVGIGMPSFIRSHDGYIQKTVNLTKIKDFPALEYLSGLFNKIPVVLDNDARVAALAEHRQGVGKGFHNMLYCPLSTGIASAIIINNELFRGSDGFSGESGHMLVTPGEGVKCGCGKKGCYMSYCSGSMIMKHINNWIEEGQSTLMTEMVSNPKELTTIHLNEAWKKGDLMAQRAFEQMVHYMAMWLANLYLTLNINCFVFGGGLLHIDFPLLSKVRTAFDSFCGNANTVYFKTAQLGDQIGIIGATELLTTLIATPSPNVQQNP